MKGNEEPNGPPWKPLSAKEARSKVAELLEAGEELARSVRRIHGIAVLLKGQRDCLVSAVERHQKTLQVTTEPDAELYAELKRVNDAGGKYTIRCLGICGEECSGKCCRNDTPQTIIDICIDHLRDNPA